MALQLTTQQARFIHAALIEASNKARAMEEEHLDKHEQIELPADTRSFHWLRYRTWAMVEHEAIDLARLVEAQSPPLAMDHTAYRLPTCLPEKALALG